VLSTAELRQATVDFTSGAETKAPPRTVLAFSGVR
jgi:hypothetical protein